MSNPSKKARKAFDAAFEKFKVAAAKLHGKSSIWELETLIDLWHACAADGAFDE